MALKQAARRGQESIFDRLVVDASQPEDFKVSDKIMEGKIIAAQNDSALHDCVMMSIPL